MKKLILAFLILFLSQNILAQSSIMLSKENAADKGISPVWPRCHRDRKTPAQCFDSMLRNHIIRNFKYPDNAKSEGLEGTVTVEFIINAKGKVEILDVQGAHRYLQREAIRIIREIPKMKPATWGEKPISIAYTVPITFIKPQN